MAALPPPPPAVNPIHPVEQVLEWIGFTNPANRTAVRDDGGFQELEDFNGITSEDIRNMAEAFSKRSTRERLNFGMRRIKSLIGVMHWVQDKARCNRTPTLDGIADKDEFLDLIKEALERNDLRKTDREQVDTISKAADPGKLKDERKWADWEPKFVNYLSTIPGVTGVPLSYVIRLNEAPAHDKDFGGDFIAECTACAPLTGPSFRADARKVHQLLKNYLISESSEQWIKKGEKKANGREDMERLRGHYGGAGNASRRIATAENLRETLHYKNERSLSFAVFLDRMEKMFNIFEEEGEAVKPVAKVRELLKRVQHSQLQEAVKALEVRNQMDGLSYTDAANFLATAVSQLPEYKTARKISETKRIRGGINGGGSSRKGGRSKGPRAPDSGIHLSDGTIHTGYYPNWKQLSREDQNKVKAARPPKGEKDELKRNRADISSLETDLASMRREIASIKAKKAKTGENDGEAETPPDDAGNAFGGRNGRSNAA